MIRIFELQGISPYRFNTDKIEVHNPDGSEEEPSRHMTLEETAAEVAAHKKVYFQFWIDDLTDLGCVIRWLDDSLVEELYHIEMLGKPTLQRAIEIVLKRFKEMALAGTAAGLVVDARARAEDYDWRSFFDNSDISLKDVQDEYKQLPDMIGIHISKEKLVLDVLEGWDREEIGDYVIYCGYDVYQYSGRAQ